MHFRYLPFLLLWACISCSSPSKPADPLKTPVAADLRWDSTLTINPAYKTEFQGLFDRDTAGKIISPDPQDDVLAKNYAWWVDKGPVIDSGRHTILVRKENFYVGDTLHIVHIFEQLKAKGEILHAGPMEIGEESFNGINWADSAITGTLKAIPGTDLRVQHYDGPVTFEPGIEYVNAITKYKLRRPGTYKIQWKNGNAVSNTIEITVK